MLYVTSTRTEDTKPRQTKSVEKMVYSWDGEC